MESEQLHHTRANDPTHIHTWANDQAVLEGG